MRASQTPTFKNVPSFTSTHGKLAGRLAQGYGMTPDSWQQKVLDGWLATHKGGQYKSVQCGLSVPRQNGKNGVLEMVELFKMAVQGRKVLHSAHEVRTCRKHFLRMCNYFTEDKYADLKRMVQTIRMTNGQEAIFLKNGGQLEFFSRSKNAGRGFTGDDLIYDECQELTEEQQSSTIPLVSSAPSGNPQIFFVGTPPTPSSLGTVFRRVHDSAHNSSEVCWYEWSVDEIGDVADRKRWYRTNPALGTRLLSDVVQGECNSMSRDSFARERLGWWDERTGVQSAISSNVWERLAVEAKPDGGVLSFGVDMTPDRSRISVGACLKFDDGSAYVELAEYCDGADVAKVVEFLRARWGRVASVVVDGGGACNAIITDLQRVGVRPTVVNASGMGQAVGRFRGLLDSGVLHHLQGQSPLDAAVRHASLRPIGSSGAYGWQRMGIDVDLSPLVAVTLATHGAFTTKRNPSKNAKIVLLQ